LLPSLIPASFSRFSNKHFEWLKSVPSAGALTVFTGSVLIPSVELSLSFSRDAAQITRRLEVAGGNDWESRLEAMSELIEAQMRAKTMPGKKQDG